jgi:hypothetical protein
MDRGSGSEQIDEEFEDGMDDGDGRVCRLGLVMDEKIVKMLDGKGTITGAVRR